jgi:DNA-binding NarL/FixJ family response regulator
MTMPRVLLADDHTLLLDAYEKLLDPECEIVGQVSDGESLVAVAKTLKPDVVVLDIEMPVLNGLEAARQIKQLLPNAKLVFLTMHEDDDLSAEAFRAGASAYLLKRSAGSELMKAIREVMRGRSYVTPLATAGLMESLLLGHAKQSSELTPRQREILHLISQGQSMKEVAAVLNISWRTVAFHKYAMMEALNITSTAELIKYAMKHDLV